MDRNPTGLIYQSTGKYEPIHWFHLVTDYNFKDGVVNTRDINNHNINSIDLDGYKEVGLREAKFSLSEYLDWCLSDLGYCDDEVIENIEKNIREFIVKESKVK